jgi:hypothetical protein
MNKQPDRDKNYMYNMWGTDKLVTDYDSVEGLGEPSTTLEGSNHRVYTAAMLREITEDDMTPKKHNFKVQNEIHEKIRNDADYDDWSYGTEPIPLREWK